MTVDLSRLDVPRADVEAHMAEQKAIACLLAARVTAPAWCESDRIAYALDVRLIETHAAVASNNDYPEWAARLAAQPTYHASKEAS
ncbi:hypothetical protein ABIE67_007837 [Streptomyces sp. V4I8]|uniref:hypothetical protein n=1 Tax=Streptomyces sp. V4I8 TaxID=3156469 RepID=UPI0035148CA5